MGIHFIPVCLDTGSEHLGYSYGGGGRTAAESRGGGFLQVSKVCLPSAICIVIHLMQFQGESITSTVNCATSPMRRVSWGHQLASFPLPSICARDLFKFFFCSEKMRRICFPGASIGNRRNLMQTSATGLRNPPRRRESHS